MKEVKFLKIDYTIQLIVGVLILLFLPILGYGLLLLLPFGIWQNISSLIMVYCYRDKKRIPHLIFTIIWGCIYLIAKDVPGISFEMGFVYIIALPACVGLWHFLLTKKDFKRLEAEAVKVSEYV